MRGALARYDLVYACLLFGLVTLGGLAYAVRIGKKGRARFERLEKQGGSVLLSMEMMEMGYWCLQPLAHLLVRLGFSANVLSWLSLAFGAVASGFLAVGYFGCGAGLATVSALLDVMDGLVARHTGTASDAGEVLDAAVDRYVEFFFLGGLVFYYRGTPIFLCLAVAALAGSFMVSYSTAKAEALSVKLPPTIMRRPERALYLTLGAALSPLSLRYWEGSGTTAYPMVAAMALVALLTHASAIHRLRLIAKEIRRRERVESEPTIPFIVRT